MSKNVDRGNWIPEIYYEESTDGVTSNLPFFNVPDDHDAPNVLFIYSCKDTGETEPDNSGNEQPIVEAQLLSYANMDVLRQQLSSDAYNDVRVALKLPHLKDV